METDELIHCVRCGRNLKHVSEDWRRDDDWPYQLNDALVLEAHGGYGMYFDILAARPPMLALCQKCADIFLEDYPGVRSALIAAINSDAALGGGNENQLHECGHAWFEHSIDSSTEPWHYPCRQCKCVATE